MLGQVLVDESGQQITDTVPIYGPATPANLSVVPASSTPSPIWSLLAGGLQSTATILGSRYAVPQLAQGQYIQKTAQGTTMYQLPDGASASSFPGGVPSLGGGMGIGTILLIGGGLLVAVKLFGSKSN